MYFYSYIYIYIYCNYLYVIIIMIWFCILALYILVSFVSFGNLINIISQLMDYAWKINRLRQQRTQTPYKIIVKHCKLIDLVIRIELTRAILMTWFSNFLRNSTIHFRMSLYLVSCFLAESHGFVAVPVTSCIKDACPNLYLYLVSEGRRNCLTLWPAQWRAGQTAFENFSENLRFVALKLFLFTRFLSPYFYLPSFKTNKVSNTLLKWSFGITEIWNWNFIVTGRRLKIKIIVE